MRQLNLFDFIGGQQKMALQMLKENGLYLGEIPKE